MVPRDVVFVEELPHTDSGKIRKKTLLEVDAAAISGHSVQRMGPS
jgi:acyl-coenzyme A synthetase/AMP-(fatty) acid ligase